MIAPPQSSGAAFARGLGVALAGGVACTSLATGALFAGLGGPRGSVAALWAIGGALTLAASLPRTRRRLGDRAALGLALGAAGLALPIAFAALYAHGEPLIAGGWRCGTGDIGLVMIGLPAAGGIVGLAIFLGTLLASRLEAPSHGTLRWTLGALAALAALGAASCLSTAVAQLDRPQPDAWVESLEAGEAIDLAGAPLGHSARRIGPGVALDLGCELHEFEPTVTSCAVRLRRVAEEATEAQVAALGSCAEGDACGREHALQIALDGPLRVARELSSGLWILRSEGGPTLAFDRSLDPAWVYPRTIPGAVAPPHPWIFAAALGALLALLALARRASLALAIMRLRGGREGRVEGEAILFDDGELPGRGLLARALPPGPALASPIGDPSSPSYRHDGGGGLWRATSGTRAEQRASLRARAAILDAFALAVLLSTSAPLWVALR